MYRSMYLYIYTRKPTNTCFINPSHVPLRREVESKFGRLVQTAEGHLEPEPVNHTGVPRS